MQVSFGVLAACFNVQGEGISYCVIQLFESVDTFGTQVINEYDCPCFVVYYHTLSYNLFLSFMSVLLLVWSNMSLPLVRWKDYQ